MNHEGLNVREVGAAGDGTTLETEVFQQAINRLHDTGGGTLWVPAGTYLVGTLFLRSHVTIHLCQGATLLGSARQEDYRGLPVDAPASEPGSRAILVAYGQHHITIAGEGTIRGQGRLLVEDGVRLAREGKLPPITGKYLGEVHRPMVINLVRCQDVRISGIEIRDGACWIQHYLDCDRLVLCGLRVHSYQFWNNDGLDIVDCRQVRVSDCDIDSGDDAICLKSNTRPCEDIVITNCVVRSFANGIKFGTCSYGGFRNIAISNIVVRGAGHSGIALECVDGGCLDNVVITNVTMRNLRHGIFMRQAGRYRSLGGSCKRIQPGGFRNVVLSNIIAEVTAEGPDQGEPLAAPVSPFPHNPYPCHISGLPGFPIENVTLSDITFITPGGGGREVAHLPEERWGEIPENPSHYPEYNMLGELPAFGWYFRHVRGLVARNLRVVAARRDDRSAVVLDDVDGASISALSAPSSLRSALIAMRHSQGVTVHDSLLRTKRVLRSSEGYELPEHRFR